MSPIAESLNTLSKYRPVFHSEADFQHAFAWEIHQRFPTASIRLERPFLSGNNQLHLDILVIREADILAIELKYKTRGLSLRLGDEQFALKDQSAQDLGRYDFIKDIQRLEQIVLGEKNAIATQFC
ncbi:MAG: hypothetical protein HY327_07980 [Chloroflexi bacterium]|nr:hypothetical protein [Chloroflexota bacterium]